ncbi:hypothetical protein BABINDRAFT_163726 [Babjeviella inositovora NRRL Y-12698]|uniref:Cytochrome c oxidase subunit 6, mitochondrial n=1 Tax=Babjeviella inositovora NRRL Y-12698 TaxID=984486 RepID=A0A1E3QHQ7_9ASCO|nr:uncharacterized protein BABINDRAFT_163726 [Babjeviella inositovora NRRL Y-12698]ODQ77226.1 hypothetical protein BABINDRAFT_163726 [Babjeviella inositovora NRRL Y-12698]
MAAPMIARPMAVRFYSAMMEDMEEHTAKFTKDLEEAYDMFEVCRVINNAFSHDLVPSPAVCETALRAARRINEYAVAVRVFEMIEAKVENSAQYEAYLDELKDIREELGIELKADLYPEGILSH